MKRFGTRSVRPASVLLAALAWGCVTQGTYESVNAEREQLLAEKAKLVKRAQRLEAENASLHAERLQLIDGMEDMREAEGLLKSDLERLIRSEAALSDSLAARESELAKLRGTYEGLVADLEAEVASGQIEIEQLREGLRLNLSQEILFPSGSAALNAAGVAVLRKVAQRLKSLPNAIEVQGHTDNVAIRGSGAYPSNWELAAARSAQVVRLFIDTGVSPDRLVVVSFGEHAPIAPNDTPEGRAKNRRIEIRLKPTSEPAPDSTATTGTAPEAGAAPAGAEPPDES